MSFKHSLSALVLAACAVGLSLSAQTPAKPETAASVAFRDAVVPAPKKVASGLTSRHCGCSAISSAPAPTQLIAQSMVRRQCQSVNPTTFAFGYGRDVHSWSVTPSMVLLRTLNEAFI